MNTRPTSLLDLSTKALQAAIDERCENVKTPQLNHSVKNLLEEIGLLTKALSLLQKRDVLTTMLAAQENTLASYKKIKQTYQDRNIDFDVEAPSSVEPLLKDLEQLNAEIKEFDAQTNFKPLLNSCKIHPTNKRTSLSFSDLWKDPSQVKADCAERATSNDNTPTAPRT